MCQSQPTDSNAISYQYPETLTWAPGSLPQASPVSKSVMTGPTLEVLTIIPRHSSATTIRTVGGKIKVYHLQDLERMQHTQGFTVWSQVESRNAQANGSAVLGSSMGT